MTWSVPCWWGIVLLGLAAGAVSGSLGVGSGVIVVPTLVLLFHFGQKSAQGMALALMIPMAVLGLMRYARTSEVQLQWPVIALLTAGAMVGVFAGTKLMARVPDAWLQRAFAIFLLAVSVRMLWPGKASSASRSAAPSQTVQGSTQGEGSKHD